MSENQTLEATLTESQQNYKKARHIYEAIAQACGPFKANDGAAHAHYSRACDLVEDALLPTLKLKKGERAPNRIERAGELPNLSDRKAWTDAIAKALKKAPAKDLEVARQEAARQQALEGQRKAEAERKKQDAAKKKAAPKKTKKTDNESDGDA